MRSAYPSRFSSPPNLTWHRFAAHAYDGQSRRVKREHFSSSATETTTYLYDGWNVIAEWHSPTSGLGLLISRIWGH